MEWNGMEWKRSGRDNNIHREYITTYIAELIRRMEYKTIISIAAFAVTFLSALFLFIRNYPSDKEFSVVFIVAGGVMLWCAWGAEAANKIECFYDKPAASTVTYATNEHDENGSITGQEQERTEGGGERMGDDKGE